MNQYPWKQNTTPNAASQGDPRYETPGGAQAKADKAEQDANEFTRNQLSQPELPIPNGSIVERHYRTESVSERALGQKVVTRSKIGTGAVGWQELDPSLLADIDDVIINANFDRVDELLTDIRVNIKSFGAVESASDNGIAIQAAIDFCASRGGGTVFIPPGTFQLGTVKGGNSALLYARSNVNIVGSGNSSVLKVKAGLNDPGKYFNVISVPDRTRANTVTNCIFKDFVIDNNGVNNLIPVGEYAKENNGIQLWYGGNIIIDNVTFQNNPGLQCIRLGTDVDHDIYDAVINNCKFRNVGTAVPGNVNQIDHSSIYYSGTRGSITNNFFANDNRPVNNATCCIEIHSDTTLVSNNIVENFSIFAIVAAETADIFDLKISNNVARKLATGFEMWVTSGDVTLRNITLENNTIESSYSIGQGLQCEHMEYPGESITLRGNTFECTESRTSNVSNGLSFRNFKEVTIINDTIRGFMADGIMVEPINGITNLVIDSANIIDCGRSTVIAENYGVSLIGASKFNNVTVKQTRIINTATQYMRNGIVSNCDANSYIFDKNEVTNVETDPNSLSRDITLSAALTGRVYINHVGNGIPETYIAASLESVWINRFTNIKYVKKKNNNATTGWVVEQGIYDSGITANGNFIAFDDGTLICNHFINASVDVTTPIGSLFKSPYQTWTFPIPFVDLKMDVGVHPTTADHEYWGNARGVTQLAAEYYILSPETASGEVNIRLSAIGRWK